ncbi:hypothetical protein CRE_15273 [Caenorhabditis remanei]|uniref:Uncharacterized protein n=2 Tax=Caenorhabditis remanei TaxID=31234 RepID=E3MBZ3_CAERE|nr:hypothetical protein CRE_15273 [Caenorhabditis remanei]
MCGEKELESSDYSSDEDTESLDSFHSIKTERVARTWAYSILFCYTLAAISFMAIFVIWFFTKEEDVSEDVLDFD